MRFLLIVLLTITCTFAFAQKKGKKEQNLDEYPLKMRMVLGKSTDSILAMHWLMHEAKDMYEGKKKPDTDTSTFLILAKSYGADAETRPMYIHLLMYTNWAATEGALADSLGKYNMKLLERFPKEVIRYFKKSETDKRIEDAEKAFQYNIAFELNGMDDPEGSFDEYADKVTKVFKSKDTEPIDKFLNAVQKQMKKK
jgi:hypothetical protein